MAQTEVLLGTAFITDKGAWQSGTAYEENDIVHTDGGIFLSLADDNISTPSTDNEQWRLWVDKTDIGRATEAADTATKATLAAITASNTQTEIAKGYNEHPPKVGDNGNWWTWDGTQYVDTTIPSRGDTLYPTLTHEGNKLYITDTGGTINQYVKKEGNKLTFTIYE